MCMGVCHGFPLDGMGARNLAWKKNYDRNRYIQTKEIKTVFIRPLVLHHGQGLPIFSLVQFSVTLNVELF